VGARALSGHAVCVYCASSSTIPEHYLRLAAAVGSGIAARGWTLVSGGGRVSMMGELAKAARARGGRTVGVIPRKLITAELADADADELLVTETMRERKALMDAHADAFLALPGGIGTLEELFEAWTSRSLGMHGKPVVLLDPDGHYDGLLGWLESLSRRGFFRVDVFDTLVVTSDLTAALDACAPRAAVDSLDSVPRL
jgi:uncharacterized protein (TIGR00730 family)